MSAVRELTDALICAGMHPADAAMLIARAGVEMVASGPSKAAIRTRKWRAGKASQTVTGDDSVTLNETVTERHIPSPNVTRDDPPLSSKNSNLEKKESKREAMRGSRLTDDWAPDAVDWQAAIEMIGPDRCKAELLKFRDHWKQQPGSKGVKLDWAATWRNWVRRSAEYHGAINGNRSNNPQRRSASADFFAGIASVAADLNGHSPAPGDVTEEIPLGRFNING